MQPKCRFKHLLLTGLLILLLPGVMGIIFLVTPEEQTQGVVQKIFYIHLALVTGMYVAIFLGMLFAAIYLASKHTWSDALSVAAVEVGYLFTTGVLISGSVWARPVWGAWWTWDPRLTTTLLIWLIYSGYMLVRLYFPNSDDTKKWCAVLAILGFLDVPIIHYSVRFLRGIHPTVITEGGIAPSMLVTLFISMAVFLLLAGVLIYLRYSVEMLGNRIGQLKRERV